MKILIVEDSKTLADVIAKRLRRLKWEVTVANTYDTAFNNIAENEYDILLCDHWLPNREKWKQWLDLAKEARLMNKTFPIIMLSWAIEACEAFNNWEIDDFMLKPINTDELIHRINLRVNWNSSIKNKSKSHWYSWRFHISNSNVHLWDNHNEWTAHYWENRVVPPVKNKWKSDENSQ